MTLLDRGSTWLKVELAEHVAGPAEAEDRLVTGRVDVAGLHVPLEQDQDPVPGLPLAHQVLAAREPAAAASVQQSVVVILREQREKGAGLSPWERHRAMLAAYSPS